jgi:hypothetical protein
MAAAVRKSPDVLMVYAMFDGNGARVPQELSHRPTRIGGRPKTQWARIGERTTGEPWECRCEAVARRSRRERTQEPAKRRVFEVQW